MKRILVAALVSLTACAAARPYQPLGDRLADEEYRVLEIAGAATDGPYTMTIFIKPYESARMLALCGYAVTNGATSATGQLVRLQLGDPQSRLLIGDRAVGDASFLAPYDGLVAPDRARANCVRTSVPWRSDFAFEPLSLNLPQERGSL